MSETATADIHFDFFERFKSFWNNPSGDRIPELIMPDAKIHFSGQGTFSGEDYVAAMAGTLEAIPDMRVVPLDYAGSGDTLYIHWRASGTINGNFREWLGVDRFRLQDGMAIEEHVIFDTTVLQ